MFEELDKLLALVTVNTPLVCDHVASSTSLTVTAATLMVDANVNVYWFEPMLVPVLINLRGLMRMSINLSLADLAVSVAKVIV